MKIELDPEQVRQIRTLVSLAVKSGIKQATNNRPYLNRKDIAKYFGVADSTITKWSSLGMPVAVIDGRKLYGKASITAWLKDHEIALQPHKKGNKKSLSLVK